MSILLNGVRSESGCYVACWGVGTSCLNLTCRLGTKLLLGMMKFHNFHSPSSAGGLHFDASGEVPDRLSSSETSFKKTTCLQQKKSTGFNDNITTQGVLGAYLDIHALLSQFDCFVHQIGFDVGGGHRVRAPINRRG